MKTAIMCGICEKPCKYSDSYAVKVEDFRVSQLLRIDRSIGTSTPVLDVQYEAPERKIRACRGCVQRMGYKTRE